MTGRVTLPLRVNEVREVLQSLREAEISESQEDGCKEPLCRLDDSARVPSFNREPSSLRLIVKQLGRHTKRNYGHWIADVATVTTIN